MERERGAGGSRPARATFVAPAGAFLAAGLALTEVVRGLWIGDVPGIGSAPPVMAPATATAVLLAAVGLLLVGPARGWLARRLGRAAALATAGLGLLALGMHLGGWGGTAGRLPAMPSPSTALGIVLTGAALLGLGARGRSGRWARGSAAATLVVVGAALVGHAYGATVLHAVSRWGAMAVSTAVALGALAIGILFAEPASGVSGVFLSRSAGGRILRRLVPVALLAPLVLGWLALAALERGLVDAAFAIAGMVVALVVVLIGYAVHQATVVHAFETEREALLVREREASDLVTTILESITDAFFTVDRRWRFTYVNREAERLLRRPRDELLGLELWTEFGEAQGTAFEREYRRAMQRRESAHFEAAFPPLGITVDVRVYPSRDGLSIFFRDVTERIAAEERIREREARFRALAENATMGIFVIDEESTIEFANPAVERIFGYSVAEMIGRSLAMLMPEGQRAGHDAAVKRYLRTGRRNIPWEGVELPGLAKDGRIIPLEISMGEFVHGGRHYFTGIARDITERKESERALRESEERYRLLAELIPQHVWTADAAGWHTYFSPRWYEFTGATFEESRGEGWMALLHPEDRERTIARWEQSLASGAPYSIEYRFRREDGDYCWFLGQAAPQRNESGEIIGWFGTLTDISERKRLEQEREELLQKEREAHAEAERRRAELERVTESRTRLLRGFTHDVKNPLGAADGYAQLLEDGVVGEMSGKQRESVQRIRQSIHKSLHLIEELMELARAEAGQIRLESAPADVAELAREAAEDFRAQAAAGGLALEVRAAGPIPAETDATRVRQILGNLLSNAVKYTPRGGITVDAEIRANGTGPGGADCIAVHVRDTGPGIPPEKQELIFQEFARLDPDARQGAGVGLAISRRIARILGGNITVDSEPGRGSTFTLWLPPAGVGPAGRDRGAKGELRGAQRRSRSRATDQATDSDPGVV